MKEIKSTINIKEELSDFSKKYNDKDKLKKLLETIALYF